MEFTGPVTLQIISDFHIEHRDANLRFEEYLEPKSDVLALVGDVGSYLDEAKLVAFLEWCSQHWQLVIFVLGNHEFYSSNASFTMQVLKERYRGYCNRFPNVVLGDNTKVDFKNVSFLCSTLWSDVPSDKDGYISRYLNDYRIIFTRPGVRFTPHDSRVLFKESLEFIRAGVNECNANGRLAVVLTHHTPSFHETSAEEYRGLPSNYGFSSKINISEFSGNPIRLWCAGHTHFNFHNSAEGYELISNQVGYEKIPCAGYSKDSVITL